MRQAFELFVRDMLAPYLERIEELSAEIEDVRRRQQSMIRLGYVSEIDPANKLIKVRHGQLCTPFIKWFAQSAGTVVHYRCPSIGEQVLLLNFAGGNNGSQSIALVGIESSQFPFSVTNPNQVVTAYGNNCAQIWDMDKSELTLKAATKITLDSELVAITKNLSVTENIAATGDVSDKVRTMATDRAIYNEHIHKFPDGATFEPDPTQ